MNVFKQLSNIKSTYFLSLVDKKTGVDYEYLVLRPDGRVTVTKSSVINLESFTKKERAFYLDMKNSMMFSVGGILYSKDSLPKTLKHLKTFCKNNGLEVFILAENIE